MDHVVERTLISKEAIAQRVAEMGTQITEDLREDVQQAPLVLMPILTGAMLFVADLVRSVPLKMSIVPVTISSYPGQATESQGATIKGGVPTDLAGKHVLVVDDILDSGRTLGLIRRVIEAQRPASVRLAVLLSKEKDAGRDEDVVVEYSGFTIQDEFVVGYGLDFDGLYRNLPEIGVLSGAGG